MISDRTRARSVVGPRSLIAEPQQVLAVAAFLFMPLATVVPMAITPLAAIGAVLVALHAVVIERRLPARASWYACLLIVLLIWGALSAAWSIDPEQSLDRLAKLTAIAVGAVILVDAARRIDDGGRGRIEIALMAGAAVGLGLVALEVATGAAINDFVRDQARTGPTELTNLNRSAVVMAIVAWLAALGVERRFGRAWMLAFLALVLVILSQLDPGAPVLALVGGAVVAVLARRWPTPVAVVLASCVTVGMIAAPWLPGSLLSPERYAAWSDQPDFATTHRLAIWSFTAERVRERPLYGWGLDAARNMPGGSDLIRLARPDGLTRPVTQLPLHPHNAFLQWWLELGLPGAALGGALIVLTIFAVPRHVDDGVAQAACLATIASGTVVACLSFGIWQGWWLSTLWLLAALTAAIARAPDRRGTGGDAALV